MNIQNSVLDMNIAKLGFGLMRLPMIGHDVDMEQTKKMVDVFIERGFTYFDTAYVYANGKSESVAKEAIVRRYPREAFQLATKLPMWMVDAESDMDRYFNESLERAGVEYFDFYLLHGLSASKSDRFPSSSIAKAQNFWAWQFLGRKKTEGRVKHIGFSFHDSAEVLDKILIDHPEAEFVQLQINYADWDDETIQSGKCYETAMKHNKPVIVMEPLKGGTLASLRPGVETIFKMPNPDVSLASWAIRYCASLDGIITVLSGMSNIDQVNDNVNTMSNFQPLNDCERTIIGNAVKALRTVEAVGCTSCRYCIDSCPQKIDIPGIFSILNEYRVYEDVAYAKRRYRNRVKESGKALDCLACGSCENRCPQKLQIIEKLREAAALFE
jgi:predicted aldo/keto reductase-like oxidoreductase